MFTSWFSILMVATFVAAVITMLTGVAGLAKEAAGDAPAARSRATRLMALRVGLCMLLLAEIIIYINYFKI